MRHPPQSNRSQTDLKHAASVAIVREYNGGTAVDMRVVEMTRPLYWWSDDKGNWHAIGVTAEEFMMHYSIYVYISVSHESQCVIPTRVCLVSCPVLLCRNHDLIPDACNSVLRWETYEKLVAGRNDTL